jgi:hypothetical protein
MESDKFSKQRMNNKVSPMPVEEKQKKQESKKSDTSGGNTTVGLFVSAKGLTDLDVITPSDPFLVLLSRDSPLKNFEKIG